MRNRIVVLSAVLLCSITWGQTSGGSSSATQSAGQPSMPGMSGHDMSDMRMKDMPMGGDKDADSDTSAHVMNSMEGHMDMGPHMKMTALRQSKPSDTARAQQIITAPWRTVTRFSIRKLCRKCTTSPTTDMPWKRPSVLIPSTRHLCSTKNTAMTTSSSG